MWERRSTPPVALSDSAATSRSWSASWTACFSSRREVGWPLQRLIHWRTLRAAGEPEPETAKSTA